MNISQSMSQSPVSRCLAFAFLSLIAASTTYLSGQDTLDQVRTTPTELLDQRGVRFALKQMEWLLARTGMTRQRLEENKRSSAAEINNLLAQRVILFESLPLEFRFADDRARSEAVSKCLQELLAVHLELATQNALLEEGREEKSAELNEARKKITELDAELTRVHKQLAMIKGEKYLADEVKQAELDVSVRELEKLEQIIEKEYVSNYENARTLSQELATSENTDEKSRRELEQQKLQLQLQKKTVALNQAEQALAHSKQLYERGSVTAEQVKADEFALENAKADVHMEKLNLDLYFQGVATIEAREQTKINREIRVLQAREEAAKSFLEQLNSAALTIQKIRRLDEEMDIKKRELELLQNRQLELQHEVDDIEILKEQVEQDLQKFLAEEAARENRESEQKDNGEDKGR